MIVDFMDFFDALMGKRRISMTITTYFILFLKYFFCERISSSDRAQIMSIRLLSPTDFIYSDDDNDRSKSLTRITTDCSSRRQTASASPFVRGVDQVVRNLRSNTYLSSFHESDRTDSGFTGDSVSTCHFTRIYHPSFKHTHQGMLKFYAIKRNKVVLPN